MREGVAVVGADQHAVGEYLLAVAETVEVAVRRRAVGEAELDHLALHVLRDQLARRALGDDLRLVHHDEPVAELLGFVHVVRGEHLRHALLLEPVEAIPEHVARLRVEAGRRLVEQEQLGVVHQRAGDRQPALHAARERLDLRLAPLVQLDEVEELFGRDLITSFGIPK